MEEHKNSDSKNKRDAPAGALKSYVKYTGMAFQMLGIIGVSAYIGFKLDEYYSHDVQWVTALMCVLGVCLSIYQVIRQLKP